MWGSIKCLNKSYFDFSTTLLILGLSRRCSGKETACQCRRRGDMGLIPGSGRSPGEGNVNLLYYSCLEIPWRGAWQATIHGVTKSWTWLSTHAHIANSTFLIHSGPNHSCLQFSSVAQSCPTLCDPMDCSMPGFPVHHQLPELAQTHVHRVGDAIQPSHSCIIPKQKIINGILQLFQR